MRPKFPSLLITDDDCDFRETLRSAFELLGFQILVAGDGEEALEIVHREPVHLLLLDMHMPRLTGLETIRRVKQFAEELPCILMSANLDDQLAEEARRVRAFSALAKPVRYAEVRRVVNRALKSVYGWP